MDRFLYNSVISFICLSGSLAAIGQAVPTASANITSSSPSYGIQPGGTLNYSLGLSETVITGYNGSGGTANSTNLFGRASLVTSNEAKPTSLIYSGGYVFSEIPGQPSSTFHNFGLSQVLATKHWNLVLSDLVSYLPSSPTTGISGIAGTGDVGAPSTGAVIGQGILTYYSPRIVNTASGSAEGKITSSTAIETSVSYGIQRFINSQGIDNSQYTGTIGPQHRINERNSIGANYAYSRFSYGSTPYTTNKFDFVAQGGNLTYEHLFSRRLSTNISIGPQSTRSSNGSLPSHLSFAANTSLNYLGKLSHAALVYYRGTDAGSGVLLGAVSDNVGLLYQRTLDRNWGVGLSGNYARTSGLLAYNDVKSKSTTFFGGIQLTRKLGHDFAVYGSYNAQTQTINNPAGFQNALNGLTQIFGFGIIYSPQSIRIGRH